MFIIEGIPSVLLSVVAFKFMPNRPEETPMFNNRERELALERANRRTRADVGRMLHRSTLLHCLPYLRRL